MSKSILEKLEWLLDLPSVTGEEAQLADALQARLAKLEDFKLKRFRNGILALPKESETKLLLAGHLDTVPPAAGQTRRLEGDRIYGCGSSDMKAGVAVMLEMIESNPQAPLGYIFYDQEEGPLLNNGLAPLLDMLQRPGTPAVVLEPTANEVQVGCVGSFHLEVVFSGLRAHAARPWQGRNAIFAALPLLSYLSKRPVDEVEVEGQIFRQVVTPTILSTPKLANAVPDQLSLNLNIRFAPGTDYQVLIDEVQEKVCEHAILNLLDVAPAGQVCHSHPDFAPWIQSQGLKVAPKQAWTDVAQLTAKGYPALNFGPGEPSQAHQIDEWAPIAALGQNYQHLLKLVESL